MDKIVINLVFHDVLRAIKSLPIGCAHIVKYSRGGHLLFVVDKNGIRVFNAYSLKEVTPMIRRDGAKITDLVLADLDRAFAVCGTYGKVERWHLPSFQIMDALPDEEEPGTKRERFYFRSCDFILDGPKDMV